MLSRGCVKELGEMSMPVSLKWYRPAVKAAMCLSLLVSLLAVEARGQSVTGSISGIIRDASNAVVPDVTVTVTHRDTGATRAVTSDEIGRYQVPGLAYGTYEVRAEVAGLQTTVVENIKLDVASNVIVNLVLKVGSIDESITVTADAVSVETTKASLEGLVNEAQIRSLPLNGRSFTQLALLQEGVSPFLNNAVGFFGGRGIRITVYGARFSQNSFLLDGMSVNDMYNNTPGSVAGVMLGVDTVEEFKVMSHNFSAEYGKAAGAVVNAISRSGTNEIHGSAFEFLRNNVLDAKNYFDPADTPIPQFKRNQFGFTLGGSIRKDKTFFFGSYEGLRERLGTTNVALVPDFNARIGLLPRPDGTLENVGVAPSVAPYLAAYPEPNSASLGGGVAQYLFSVHQPADEDYFALKIDHNLSDKDFLSVRYTLDDGKVTRIPGNSPLPLFIEPETSRNQYVTITHRRVFSTAGVNSFRLGFNRSYSHVEDLPVPGTTPPPPFRPDLTLMGDISVPGLTRIGTDYRLPITNALNVFELADDMLIARKNHSLKFGFLAEMIPFNISQWAQKNGSARFNNLRSFLQGVTGSFMQAVPGSDVDRALRQFLFAFYIQDDWRWKPNFVWNLGIRYEPTTVPTERYGRTVGLMNPHSDTQMTIGPPNKNPSLLNFMPRIGFAWDPFKDQKTSVRAGAGIFYDPVITGTYVPTISLVPPFYVRATVYDGSFPDAFANFQDFSQIVPNTWTPYPFDLETPYLVHYTLSVERELNGQNVLSIGYAGSRGIKLPRQVEGNPFTPVVKQADGRYFFPGGGPRQNPHFGSISLRQFDGNSFFNSLFAKIERRFRGAFSYQVSYTFGKSIDDNSQINSSDSTNAALGVQNPFERTADRGLSNFDMRHNLTINYSYELPFGPGRAIGSSLRGISGALASGWLATGIVTLSSGNPFTVLIGGTYNPCNCGPARPDLVPGADMSQTTGDPSQWFDPKQFVLPAKGYFGNVGRNTLRGPGRQVFDMSFIKNSVISEGVNLEFRAEFFNVFNHPNFATPTNSVLTAGGYVSTAGRITRTVTTSRQIQFGLKVLF
jgi:hypothetical protein